jgi:hypothetical protein
MGKRLEIRRKLQGMIEECGKPCICMTLKPTRVFYSLPKSKYISFFSVAFGPDLIVKRFPE